jgi:signal recognition particle receptor subunit beta
MEESRALAEVNARIVYWGVEGAGKRTNLRVIHAKLRPDHRGELRELPTRLDPTVYYAMLPIELGEVGGVRTRIQVLTAPAGPEQAPTRQQLLDRVDGVVFVADARRERLSENLACFEELRVALAAYGRSPEQVPMVIQYNKSDLSDPYALEELHRKLALRGVAAFEAVARDGTAVLQTLTTISKRVIRQRREENEREPTADAPQSVSPPPGTTQFLVRMTEPEPEAALADVDPGDSGAGDDPLFEASFQEVAEATEFTQDLEIDMAPALSLGEPTVVAPMTLRVPVRIRDGHHPVSS